MLCQINISVSESTASFLVKTLPNGVTFEPFGNEGRFIFDAFHFRLNVDLDMISIQTIAAYIARQIRATHVQQIEINGQSISVHHFKSEENLKQKIIDCIGCAV